MVYKYIRFSTKKQEELSQDNIIEEYLQRKGMRSDITFRDEGVSGGRSYTQRNLFKLCTSLKRNDTVVVSEVSRITRSGIGELCEIIENYFKPNGLRLIICNVGIDIDCSNIDPMTEMQLYIFAAVAKMEKELIRSRTQSAIDCIKDDIEAKGYHITRKGKMITTLGSGRTPGEKCHKAAGEKSASKAASNANNIAFERYIRIFVEHNGNPEYSDKAIWQKLSDELNLLGYKTSRGLEFTPERAKAMFRNMLSRKENEKKERSSNNDSMDRNTSLLAC